jgi:DNA-binding transcriptional regulator YiaG
MEPKEYIKLIRRRLGLSQDAFGKSLGKSRDIIANYENGRAKPPPDFMEQIKVLDKKTKRYRPIEELIGG